MNHNEFTDVAFLVWLEQRVNNTSNTQKLKVKRKHFQRLAGITAGNSIYQPPAYGGSIKLERLTERIESAKKAISARVVAKLMV